MFLPTIIIDIMGGVVLRNPLRRLLLQTTKKNSLVLSFCKCMNIVSRAGREIDKTRKVVGQVCPDAVNQQKLIDPDGIEKY